MEAPAITILVVSSFFFLLACSGSSNDLSKSTIEEIARMIQEEVGDAEADSADRCDMMPIGVKPAGGPWGYLVFSAEKSDRDKLERLVERYNELDAERNREEGRMSTADFATEPALTLRNGVCHGEGQYAWNPGDILDFNDIELD
jgi:hypothetical protein